MLYSLASYVIEQKLKFLYEVSIYMVLSTILVNKGVSREPTLALRNLNSASVKPNNRRLST